MCGCVRNGRWQCAHLCLAQIHSLNLNPINFIVSDTCMFLLPPGHATFATFGTSYGSLYWLCSVIPGTGWTALYEVYEACSHAFISRVGGN